MAKLMRKERSGRRGAGAPVQLKAALEGAMTIYEAAADKQTLLDALDSAAEIEIDLSAVTEMDTAGVQVLMLVKREAAKQEKGVRLVAHSPAAMDILNCYHLVGYFGDPVVIQSHEA